MREDRRRLLAAIAAGLGTLPGCAALGEGDPADRDPYGIDEPVSPSIDDDDDADDGNDEPDDLGGPIRPGAASVVDLETGDRTLALTPVGALVSGRTTLAVEFAATATADGPARVSATVANPADEPRSVELSEIPLFDGIGRAEHVDEGVEPDWLFVPTGDHDAVARGPVDEPTVEYERGPEGYWRLASPAEVAFPDGIRLDPGESLEGECVVVGEPGTVGRPTGAYESDGVETVEGRRTTLRIAAWETSAPGVDPDSRYESGGLAPLPDVDVEWLAWYHEANRSWPAYLEPSAERGELPATITFELVNHGREPMTGGSWRPFKLVDDAWFPLLPQNLGWTRPEGSVAPGRSRTWSLRAFSGEGSDEWSSDSGAVDDDSASPDQRIPVPFLGGGRYAFAVAHSLEEEIHAAAFDLVGDPVTVVPTDDLEVTRDGAVVRATSRTARENEGPWSLSVERVGDVDDGTDLDGTYPARVIPEQVMRPHRRALRNALSPFEDGVERVVLETDPSTVRSAIPEIGLGVRTDVGQRLRYEGTVYELAAEPADEDEF